MLDLENNTKAKLTTFLAAKGFAEQEIKQITALPILHYQWELDSTIWLINLVDGDVVVLGTNHGRLSFVSKEELQAKYQEYQDLASSYKQILSCSFRAQ